MGEFNERCAAAMDDCEQLLRKHWLPVPRVQVKTCSPMWNWGSTDGRTIWLGVKARYRTWRIENNDGLRETLLHELFHVLVQRIPPPKYLKAFFGTQKEWDRRRHRRTTGLKESEYMTSYAMSHPEEDFVETATWILLVPIAARNKVLREKIKAVRAWFKLVRRRRRR